MNKIKAFFLKCLNFSKFFKAKEVISTEIKTIIDDKKVDIARLVRERKEETLINLDNIKVQVRDLEAERLARWAIRKQAKRAKAKKIQ